MQEDIITSVANGYDTLALMPTGGGKSITFQVPALEKEGLCLVITPLVALMKDQVKNLKSKGIKAMCIHAELNHSELITALDNCTFGNYKFLYLSPERLGTELFLKRLIHLPVSMIAVDEAHCISQWGYDFRPSFLEIKKIRELIPHVPVLALTATATPDVVKDIMKQLAFTNARCFQKSFARPNISYLVRATQDKFNFILDAIEKLPGSAIVYTRNRDKTKEIAEFLKAHNISAGHFHAGLQASQKDATQQAWMNGDTRVIVATNAFGMGIDKPDVRLVIHADIPDSLEAYFQEAGRAGRDQKRAYAVLLHHPNDPAVLKRKVSDQFPEIEYIHKVYLSLAYYFTIAEGSGQYTTRAFNLYEFCKIYKLNLIQTESALKLLKQLQYIDYDDSDNKSSIVHFLGNRDSLYTTLSDNPTQEKVIHCLLRSYSGLFSSYVRINEAMLAERTGLSREQIYRTLIQLDKIKILKYIPKTTDSYITYLTNRVSTEELRLKRYYTARKEVYKTRIKSVLEYFTSDLICRSRFLLNYFGEKQAKPCEQCDVCHKNKHKSFKQERLEQAYNELLTQLKKGSLSISKIPTLITDDENLAYQILNIAFEREDLVLEGLMIKQKESS